MADWITSLIITVVLTLVCAVGLFWMLWRRKTEVIAKRGLWLVCSSFFFCILGMWLITLSKAPLVGVIGACNVGIVLQSFYFPMWFMPYIIRAMMLDVQYRWNKKKLRPQEVNDADPWFRRYSSLTKTWCHLAVYLSALVLNVIATGAIVAAATKAGGAPEDPAATTAPACFSGGLLYLSLFWVALLFVWGAFYVFRLFRTSDAYHLRTELMGFIAMFPIGIALFSVSGLLTQDERPGLVICFICIMICIVVSIYYPIYLSYRPEWRKVSSSRASSIQMEGHRMTPREMFRFCLHHEALLEHFKRYCTELWCAENIQFYLVVQEFKASALEGDALLQRAKEIVEAFVDSRVASSPVNLDQQVQKRVLNDLGGGGVTRSLFDEAEEHVLRQLEQDTFAKFRLSGRLARAWREAGLGALDGDQRTSTSSLSLPLSPAAKGLLKDQDQAVPA